MPTITIEPNEKYRFVITGEHDDWADVDDEETWQEHEHADAADAYLNAIDNSGPGPVEKSEYPELTWDDISVPKDPDLVALMATYFDGVEPEEPTDLIRAKLRLVNVEHMANAQVAAKAEWRNTLDASGLGTINSNNTPDIDYTISPE